MKQKACLYQVFRPSIDIHTQIEGWGDCAKCVYHADNRQCNGFREITVYFERIENAIK